jgi:hypothetical protein
MEHMGEPALAPSLAGRNFVADKAEVRRTVEAFLDSTFNKQPGGEVARAARYAVGGPAHRWRAIVAVASGRIFPRRCAYVGPAFGLRRGACARGFACARRPAEYGRCEGQARQALHASRLSVMGSRHRAGLLVMEASWATS